ncbi:MAG: hypothetical protein QW655_03015 [Nitrososphaerota archaeon]|nr:hypothetical protein [Candidatus Geocrenenecus dongiae]
MVESVLDKTFYEIWHIGEVDDLSIDKIIDYMNKAISEGARSIRLRFYLNSYGDLSYIQYIRRILLNNTLATIVVEDRVIEELGKDVEKLNNNVIVIMNKVEKEFPGEDKVRIVKVV